MYHVDDMYVGADYYFIMYKAGTHHLCMETSGEEVYEVIFTGWYEKCRKILDDIVSKYYESRF